MILRTSVAALGVAAISVPVAAQDTQTSEEKIEALELKVKRLEALVEQLMAPESSTADGTKSMVQTRSAPQKAGADPAVQTPPTTPPVVAAAKYVPKPVGGGKAPSQNIAASPDYGNVSCAMRVYKDADAIMGNDTAKAYFKSAEAKEEGKFRLVSPELSFAVREEPSRVAECDLQQVLNSKNNRKSWADKNESANNAIRESGVASSIPGRPLQLGGVRPTFELGNSSTATLTLTAPFYGRRRSNLIDKDIDFDEKGNLKGIQRAPGFRPTIFSPFLEFSTPLSDGAGLIFTGTDDDDDETDSVEFADKISIRAGFDWLNFRGVHYYETEKAIDTLLNKAVKTCLSSVRAKRDYQNAPSGAADELMCARENVIDWVLAFKKDTDTRSGFTHQQAKLAEQLANLMWRAPDKAVPTVGFGASVKYTTQDFKFQQASVMDVDGDDKKTVVPDFSIDLADAKTEVTDNFEIEAHGLIYLDLMGHKYRKATPAGKVPGILFVPQFTYTSTHKFADDTKFTTCDFVPSIRPANCSEIQIDRPRRRSISSLSLEARGRMLNVPFLNEIGFAPKVSYRLDDDGLVFDLPVYFATKGELSSGIRARYTSGLNDLLGNPLDDKWEVSLFFTPLTFTAFK